MRFLVTLGAGSGADIGARLFADRLSQRWGQPVVVENRPGGDGIVAINAFVSAHDDHVLLFSPTASFTAHPFLHDHLPYKPSDLDPIVRVSNTVIAIAVPKSLGVNSLSELVALARSEPGKLNWAGVTGALDFMFAGWLKQEGLDISKVAYKNPVDAANDLAEGRVQVYEASLAIVRPQLQSGKIKLLAVTNTVRAPSEPDVPTVKEPVIRHLTLDGLVGLFGPAGMPLELRQRIAKDFRAVADDAIKQKSGNDRSDPKHRRPGGVRQIDRRTARRGGRLRQRARHCAVAAELTPTRGADGEPIASIGSSGCSWLPSLRAFWCWQRAQARRSSRGRRNWFRCRR